MNDIKNSAWLLKRDIAGIKPPEYTEKDYPDLTGRVYLSPGLRAALDSMPLACS